jgi:hypothetical protein
MKSTAEPEENNSVAQRSTKDQPDRIVARAKTSRDRNKEPEPTFSFIESFLPKQAERNEMISSSVSPDKYMIYSDGDGNVVRLPKKVFSAFACADQDIICKQRLQQLREKFASSAMTADFTGLLEILKSLQENQ